MRLLSWLQRLLRLVVGAEAGSVPRPSVPLRIPCLDTASIPSVTDLGRLAIAGRHIVLQFPPACEGDKRSLIEQLRPGLHGHSVFDSGPGPDGTTCVTVLKIIEEHVVLENLPLFLAAIRDFSDTARDLCRRLAEAHGLRPEELLVRRKEVGDKLPGGWRCDFHGFECCFSNARTGQVVDVRICFGGEFSVLDPYFLSRFIRATPAHREAARLLGNDFHDACRVLGILRARGHLREHEAACDVLGGMVMSGLILNTDEGAA